MALDGENRKYEHKYGFRMRIEGVEVGSFNKCSELSAEVAKILIREGGGTVADITLGLVTIPDVTLERGAVAADTDLYNLFRQSVDLVADKGVPVNQAKFNMDIVVTDRAKNEEKSWACTGCLVTKYVAGEWDNDADELTMEKVTIAVTDWQLILGGAPVGV